MAAGDHRWRIHSWEKKISELFGHLSTFSFPPERAFTSLLLLPNFPQFHFHITLPPSSLLLLISPAKENGSTNRAPTTNRGSSGRNGLWDVQVTRSLTLSCCVRERKVVVWLLYEAHSLPPSPLSLSRADMAVGEADLSTSENHHNMDNHHVDHGNREQHEPHSYLLSASPSPITTSPTSPTTPASLPTSVTPATPASLPTSVTPTTPAMGPTSVSPKSPATPATWPTGVGSTSVFTDDVTDNGSGSSDMERRQRGLESGREQSARKKSDVESGRGEPTRRKSGLESRRGEETRRQRRSGVWNGGMGMEGGGDRRSKRSPRDSLLDVSWH